MRSSRVRTPSRTIVYGKARPALRGISRTFQYSNCRQAWTFSISVTARPSVSSSGALKLTLRPAIMQHIVASSIGTQSRALYTIQSIRRVLRAQKLTFAHRVGMLACLTCCSRYIVHTAFSGTHVSQNSSIVIRVCLSSRRRALESAAYGSWGRPATSEQRETDRG